MNEDIRSLIESLRRGQYDDPAEKISLLAAALLEHSADQALLDSLLLAPQIPLRLAALEVCRQKPEPTLIPTLLRLVEVNEDRVRTKLCEVLGKLTAAEAVRKALQTLAEDFDGDIRRAVVKATSGQTDFLDLHRELLLNDPSWSVRHSSASALGEQEKSLGLGALLTALAQDDDSDVQQRCADLLERALQQRPEEAAAQLPTDIAVLAKAERQLKSLGGRRPALLEWLGQRTREQVNPATLARFGTDLTAQALAGTLPRGFRLERTVQLLVEHFRSDRIRSAALIGKTGCGKSSVVNELVYALARPENGGWRVLRMSPTDFMAGTKYVGEWETKLRELVEAVRRPRKILVYIPNLADLASMGRWAKSDANVASALAPYLEEGSLLVLGESTPEEFERGLGGESALQRLFERFLLEEFTQEQTRAVLSDIREHTQANLSDGVLQELQEASEFFLSHLTRPGNAAMLLRSVITTFKDSSRALTRRDVLDVLSQSTGVPAELLDDVAPLDLAQLQSFFDRRIIGQPEAVAAMVDLVTLIKAGLTDPQKPFGVFLFVGPTGVGKTELARALAEFIFGDSGRLLRFDMSEFASPDGFTRLIGGRGENGLLTDAVRQRPFSVVLLDEIEKSHVNVFDLCLQIFDAGRLTDGRGRLVDFRRSIVILTSNIGAQIPPAPLGFGRTETAPAGDSERTFRELARFFRPEFLNRLDRIVHFQPLSLETAERIARRELELVLQRSGIARRGLAVSIDPDLVALLVKQGYSPHFGARPLKRTVETMVLLPLARAIATGRTSPRTVLTLKADGDSVAVRLAHPPRTRAPADTTRPVPAPGRERVARLQNQYADLVAEPWPSADRKSELLEQTRQPGFYQDPVRRDATFDELSRLEQYLSRRTRLKDALDRLEAQADATGAEERASFAERASELESELEQLQFITRNPTSAGLSDAYVVITQVKVQGASQKAVETLIQTYSGLARRRHFQASLLAEYREERLEVAVLQILGLGGLALIAGEAGLHEFNRRTREKNPRSGREQTHEDTTLVRVEVFPQLGEPPKKFGSQAGLKATSLPSGTGRWLENAAWRIQGFHTPSIRSLDLWFAGTQNEALTEAARLLHSQIQQVRPTTPPEGESLIRRYDLGIGSRIKDLRTGRTTTRLAQFFRGQIALPPPEPEG